MNGFGATGSFATGAAGAGGASPPVEVSIADSLTLASITDGIPQVVLQQAMGLADEGVGESVAGLTANVACLGVAEAEPLRTLRAALSVDGAAVPTSDLAARPSDHAMFSASLGVIWRMLLEEDLVLAGTVAGQATRMTAVIDTLRASGLATSRNEAQASVATVIALHSLVAGGWSVSAADSAAFQASLHGAVRAATELVASVAWAGEAGPRLHITAVVADGVALPDDAAASLEAVAAADDGVLLHATLRLGDDEFVGWVLNEGAPSQYTHYPFNGLSAFGSRYVGTAADGVYLLEGEDDAGEPIEARIKTALMDFGAGVNKRIPDVYVAFAGGNKLVCKVVTVHPRTGQKTEAVYETTLPPGSEMHNGRIKLGQGLESRYWQFTLANVDGASFDIDELTFRPLFLDRRL